LACRFSVVKSGRLRKESMTEVVSFLKGKSAVAVAQQCGGRQGHGNRATFRAREGMRSPRWDVKQSTCAVISAPRSSALSKAGMKTVTAKSRCARASGSPWGCSPPSSPPLCGGVMTQALSAGVSGSQQNQPARICGLFSMPEKFSSTECVRAGRTDLAGGLRASYCRQGQKGRICQVF